MVYIGFTRFWSGFRLGLAFKRFRVHEIMRFKVHKVLGRLGFRSSRAHKA